jgi:hypothetical protein
VGATIAVLGSACSASAQESSPPRHRSTPTTDATTSPPPTTAPSLTPEGDLAAAGAFKTLAGYEYVDPPDTAVQSFRDAVSGSSDLLELFDGFGLKVVSTNGGQVVASLMALSIRPRIQDATQAYDQLLNKVSPLALVETTTLSNARVTAIDDHSGLQQFLWPHERVMYIAFGPDRQALEGVMTALVAASG